MDHRLYIVAYDISDPKRWRRIFKLMKGYGEWVQLSVFQCRLTPPQHAELIALLDPIINHNEDHIIILDLGPAASIMPRVVSLGKAEFSPIELEPVVI
jgi:CRISPR-associated protein Cas2